MRIALAALSLALLSFPLSALEPSSARAGYDHLQKDRFSAPVPASLTLTRDTARWTMTAGTVRVMEPLADGTVTGFLFEGAGEFEMIIPDRYELAQLRRYARRPEMETLRVTFTQLLVRTSNADFAKLVPPAAAPYAPLALAAKRKEAWLVDTFDDVDARIIAALLNPGGEQFIADMKTSEFDWLRYDYDSSRSEEIAVVRADTRGAEVWVSLDRAGERTADGRPTGPVRAFSMDHIDVRADLTHLSTRGEVGRHHQKAMEGRYVVEETFRGIAPSTTALQLGLIPTAKEVKAFDTSGAPLTVLRDHIGKRSAILDNRFHDDDMVVVLSAPLLAGQEQRVRFEYELETANFAPGREWYPTVPEAFEQNHTARLEITVRRKNELRSMGRLVQKTENDGKETTVWIVDRPAKMITFSTATRFEEVEVRAPNIPPITAFGPDYQFSNTAKLRNVAADVANSMQYFQILFDSKVGAEHFYVTSIAAGHGQAFDGFLHLTEGTFISEHAGASELFRAHEVAHAWWGHKVGWRTYRDQWMSEAFSEYCAMMFVKDFVRNGENFYEEILRSYEGIVQGNMAGGFSRFNRPWLIERNPKERGRLGPIGHGYRASTLEIPTGYLIQTYFKGPLVLHMLRTILRYQLGSDQAFIQTMRDFLREYDGKTAGTEDFRRILERNVGSDMGWFFDAWIYRAEIPSYTWKYDVKPEGKEFVLTIDLERRDVSAGFVTVIPVRVEMEGGQGGILFIPSKENRQTVSFKLPARPKSVVFAPDSSLLASVKRN